MHVLVKRARTFLGRMIPDHGSDAPFYAIPFELDLIYVPPHQDVTAKQVLLGDRLMVGQQVLALQIGVRAPVPQPLVLNRAPVSQTNPSIWVVYSAA